MLPRIRIDPLHFLNKLLEMVQMKVTNKDSLRYKVSHRPTSDFSQSTPQPKTLEWDKLPCCPISAQNYLATV
jgi:hypothetical protein